MNTYFYRDELFTDAVELTIRTGMASAARLQSNLQIGPSRAARLIDEMREAGIIGTAQGNRPSPILLTLDEWNDRRDNYVWKPEETRAAPVSHPSGGVMYCKYCGRQISTSSKFCDSCGKPTDRTVTEPKKKKKKHPILGAIAAVLAFFLVIGSCGNTDADSPSGAGSGLSPAASTKPAPKVYGIGDRQQDDGVAVTLNDVYEVEGNIIMEPADGNVYVLCDFTIENNTRDDLIVSSVLCFEAYFDDFAVEYSIGALSSMDASMQLDSTLAPGKKIKGVVGYEVPEDWSDVEISYQPDVLSTNVFTFNHTR